ncbi:tetratricopeptide repeat protein [Thalassobaculum sp.]|uniref:tetratricopeptide repeat protein n=1 Tax=Thalassobaculum sp. TaxID=2022740 RepID=UPI0032ECF453
MDFTLVAYTVSIFATLLAMNTYADWGVAEVHVHTVPPYLEESGYTSQVIANQVVDAMHQIQLEVASLDEASVLVQGQVQPVGQLASYFGFIELLRATEGTLGLGPSTVEIEVTQHDDIAHWRMRGDHAVRGPTVRRGELPVGKPDELMQLLGQQVVGFVSPFEALAYQFIQDAAANEYDATITAASSLLLDCQRRWAWACTDANLKNAYLLRGMAFLSAEQTARAFDDFDSANKIGTKNALGVAFYGDAYAALGQEEAAQRQYQRAKQLDPAIGERFYQLARGYAQGGNQLLADRRYTTAADLGIASEAFLVDWGDTLFALGWYDAALERYRAAEAVDPENDLYSERIDRTLEARDEAKATQPGQPAETPKAPEPAAAPPSGG